MDGKNRGKSGKDSPTHRLSFLQVSYPIETPENGKAQRNSPSQGRRGKQGGSWHNAVGKARVKDGGGGRQWLNRAWWFNMTALEVRGSFTSWNRQNLAPNHTKKKKKKTQGEETKARHVAYQENCGHPLMFSKCVCMYAYMANNASRPESFHSITADDNKQQELLKQTSNSRSTKKKLSQQDKTFREIWIKCIFKKVTRRLQGWITNQYNK